MLICRPDLFLLLPFQESLEGSCLRKVSVAWTEHRNQKQLAEGDVPLHITGRHWSKSGQEIKAGACRQEPNEAEALKEQLAGLLPMASSVSFYTTQYQPPAQVWHSPWLNGPSHTNH